MKKHYGLSAAIGLVMLISGCQTRNTPFNGTADVSSSEPSGDLASAPAVSEDPSKINGTDIRDALSEVRKGVSDKVMSNTGEPLSDDELKRNIRNAAIYDLDFDGTDELLIVSTFVTPEIHVFKKSDGKIEETTAFPMPPYSYMNDRLEMKSYENGSEKYYYFTFYEGNGVMKATVLGALKPNGDSYEVEYLYSWGTLEYPDLPEPVKNEFYRKGWDRNAAALNASDPNDIPKETLAEALKSYNITL